MIETRRHKPKEPTMRLSYFCLVIAALSAIVGMTLGIHMGLTQDFTLAPAHAHNNRLGWVGVSLCGLYYRQAGTVGPLG
jgi:hypothetical protein